MVGRTLRLLPLAIAAMLLAAPGCKVTVPGLDVPSLSDEGTDPGRDDGAPDTAGTDLARDPGGPGDTGTDPGNDPGIDLGTDPGKDVPVGGPCDPLVNATCGPVACDDGNAATTNDRCQGWSTPEGEVGCGCAGDTVPLDPCAAAGDMQCYDTVLCDDGVDATTNDRCQWDASTAPGKCVCKGDVTVVDPCFDPSNPDVCLPRACNNGGLPGICGTQTGTGECTCGRLDPCAARLTRCEPVQCWYKKGTLGYCDAGTLLECECVAPVYPPCGEKLNPTCSSLECDLGNGLLGRCVPDRLGTGCGCVKAALDPCGDEQNPECKPDACQLLGGARGTCMFSPLGHCGCFPGGVG